MGESNKYAVVEFPNDQVSGRPLVQEVPMHWVTDDETKCWWPPKNASKEIKNCSSPTETWKMYPIVLLKICDNLSDARLKCIQSSDAEQNDEEMGKHMRKKRETYRHMFRDSSYSPPPVPNSVFVDESSHCTDISNSLRKRNEYAPGNDLFTNILKRNEYVPSCGLANINVPDKQLNTMNLGNRNETVVYNNKGDGNPISGEYCGSLEGTGSGSACSYTTLTNYVPTPIPRSIPSADIEELKNSLTTLTVEIKKIAKTVMESNLKISNIEEILLDRNKTTSEATREFKKLFPLKSKEELIKFTDELDDTQIDSLRSFLLGIGGLGPRDHHSRMMKTLLTNELGMVCSWKGLRGNMKLQHLKLFDVCGDVLKSHWNITEKEFELFTQDWLRHCAQRKKRADLKLGDL